jgi:hypothetical protein
MLQSVTEKTTKCNTIVTNVTERQENVIYITFYSQNLTKSTFTNFSFNYNILTINVGCKFKYISFFDKKC